jgi:hypothetical protein
MVASLLEKKDERDSSGRVSEICVSYDVSVHLDRVKYLDSYDYSEEKYLLYYIIVRWR